MKNSVSERWSGDRVRKARALIAARGWPQPCCRCGRPVSPHDRWQADHYPISRAQAKLLSIPLDSLPLAAAHGRCNEAAGGWDGAALTNARRAIAKQTSKEKGATRPSRGMPSARRLRGI